MLNYSELPELVVCLIIQDIYKENDLAKSLPILGTCRLWRYVGLPIVYQTVYYVGDDSAIFKTNIDIMKSLDMGGFARKLNITMSYTNYGHLKLLFDTSNNGFSKDFPNIALLTITRINEKTNAASEQLANELTKDYSNNLKIAYRDSFKKIYRTRQRFIEPSHIRSFYPNGHFI